jgi:hypothetical protein
VIEQGVVWKWGVARAGQQHALRQQRRAHSARNEICGIVERMSIAAITTARLVGAPCERHDDVEKQTEATHLQLSAT